MKNQTALNILVPLIAILVLVSAGMGLFWQDGGSPFAFTTLRGQTVQISGQGLYHYDTAFRVPIFRGTDAVTLFAALPMLIAAFVVAQRGSLRGRLFLAGILAYFLYNAASIALGVAYNNLFLVYVAYFSASLFAFGLAIRSIDLSDLSARVSPGLPRRGIAILLIVAGLAVLVAWLGDIIGPLVSGGVPGIASYTTEATYVFDLGIIVPACGLSAILLLRRNPLGLLSSLVLLVLLAVIGLVVATQTIFQSLAGFNLGPGEFVGKAGSFMVLSLFAIGLTVRYLRGIGIPAGQRAKSLKPARAAAR
ncbi:MAG TPA: hypothetical protein VMT46_01850 [Anaerolineaceae bacterium]|nr:hypothetical protein [Anaerolineaceae bacterium]